MGASSTGDIRSCTGDPCPAYFGCSVSGDRLIGDGLPGLPLWRGRPAHRAHRSQSTAVRRSLVIAGSKRLLVGREPAASAVGT